MPGSALLCFASLRFASLRFASLRFASLRCGLQRFCAEHCKKHLCTNQKSNKAAGACRIVQICDVEAYASLLYW